MIPYTRDYIASGNVFADEIVLCLRCGTKIMGLSYVEMPDVNDPTKKVNVAHKKKFGNYRLLPVVLLRRGRESITNLPFCQECIKEIVPERDTDKIIKQIKRGMQIEARYVGMSEEAVEAISRAWADAQILRKLNPQEIAEGKILQEVA
jgi:hypothetical protein